MNNSASARVRRRIEQLYAEGAVVGDDNRRYDISPVSVPADKGEFIRDLCLREGAKSAIEIGMAWGLSTLHILEALAANGAGERAHLVLDPFESAVYHNAAIRLVHDVGLESMVEFHGERSELFLPRLVSEGRVFDFAFIDGDHRLDGVFIDAAMVHRLLRPGGVMVLDDSWCDAVAMTGRFVESSYGYSVVGEYPRDRGARRPRAIAYRKPMQEKERGQFDFHALSITDFDRGEVAPKPRANLLARDALVALGEGRRREARRYLRRALWYNPWRVKNYFRLARTYLPASVARALSGGTANRERS